MHSQELSEFLTGIISAAGAELDELEVTPAGKRRVVRVIVDGDGASGTGLNLDEIAEITKAVSKGLDQTDLLGEQPYTLEVSTRGVSRPLARPAHYRRNLNRLVKLLLTDGKEVLGRIKASDDESVTVELGEEQTQSFNFDQIRKAVVQVELNRSEENEEN